MHDTLQVFTTYVDGILPLAGGLIANHAEADDEVIVIVTCYPGSPSKVVYPEVDGARPYGRFETRERYAKEAARSKSTMLPKRWASASSLPGITTPIARRCFHARRLTT